MTKFILCLYKKVKITIKSVNEFEPRFILPKKQASSGVDDEFTNTKKMFLFRTEENKDFNLRVKAVDGDKGLDGEIIYRIEKLNNDDTFEIESRFNESAQALGN